MPDDWIHELTNTPDKMRLYQRERVILEATELVCKVMDERGVDKSELARRLGETADYVTELLDDPADLTLRELSDALCALGIRLCLCHCQEENSECGN